MVVEDSEEEEIKEKAEDKLHQLNGKLIKPVLLKCDITEKMKEKCFDLAFESLMKYRAEKEMSEYVKDNLDKEYEPEWQCVIGKDFSVAFSFEIENFIFFQIEDTYFLFYKL